LKKRREEEKESNEGRVDCRQKMKNCLSVSKRGKNETQKKTKQVKEKDSRENIEKKAEKKNRENMLSHIFDNNHTFKHSA
jgi:hypothetical protein